MTTPNGPDDEGHIADTGMFKRFVEYERGMDDEEPELAGRSGWWIALGTIVLIIVIAVVVWLLVR